VRRALVVAITTCLAAAALVAAVPGAARAEGLLECGTPADSDETTRKARAKEHFDRAEELYAAGEYELAIPEYRSAYCLLPNADPIYNIGQAYERLVDYERAVVWFEEYIRQLPPERTDEIRVVGNRIAVLRRLTARIRVATDPPGASITLDREGVTTHGKANSKDPLKVTAGTYTMHVELPGYLPVTETFTAEIGQPYTYSYRLTPKTARLSVTASPADARIFVDGKIAGIGSYSDRLSIGDHKITVEAAGRPSEEREVSLSSDDVTTVSVKMQPPRPRNGRFELLIATTLGGIMDGLALGLGFDRSPEFTVGLALGGGALGFFTPYAFLPDYVPAGRTSLAIGMGLWGFYEGFALDQALRKPDVSSDQGIDAVGASIAVAGSLVFAGASLALTRNLHVSEGDAAIINSGAIWGSEMAFFTWLAFGEEEGLGAPFALAGLNVGLLIGGLLSTRTDYSRGHVALIDVAGVAGLIAGTALAGVAADSDASTARFSLGGSAIGLIVGALLTRNFDDEPDVTPVVNTAEDLAGDRVTTFGFTWRW
jgi:hypothetical protein